jgi:membrane-associated phospholipid phosphatase
MDQKLLLLINHTWTTPALDRFMAVMSSLDFWLPLFLVAAVVVALRAGFRGRAFLLTGALILGINDGVIGNSLKHGVHRLRPHEAVAGVRQVDLGKAKPRVLALVKPLKILSSEQAADVGQGRSFPSGHVLDTMSIAVLAMLFYPRWGWLCLFVPLVVGYSRVYVGSHWPSDVAASVFIGGGATLLLATGAELLWRRQGRRLLPRLHAAHPTLFAAT